VKKERRRQRTGGQEGKRDGSGVHKCDYPRNSCIQHEIGIKGEKIGNKATVAKY